MSEYIPEIGDLFTVVGSTGVYLRCSHRDIKSYFGTFVPENYIYFMYKGFSGEYTWNFFGKFSEFKPAVQLDLTNKENKMEQKIITVNGSDYVRTQELAKHSCRGCAFGVDSDHCKFASRENLCSTTESILISVMNIRPPSGIMPLNVHNATRLNALMDTLQRYAETGLPAKEQWVQEVKSLIEYERSPTHEALAKVPFKL